MSNATGQLAAISPRPFTLKAAVAALAGIGLLSSASVWAQADAVAAPVAAVAETASAAAPEGEVAVVTVSGVRRSAQNSQQIKMR